MSITCAVFIAASVDGFIARPDGDVDWLHGAEYSRPDAGDFGYGAFMRLVDFLVMGSRTFEKVRSFSPWPYGKTPVIVLSSRNLTIPTTLQGKVRAEDLEPEELVSRLEAEGARRLYIDGGATIQRFLKAGLINELTITQIPILLGGGIPLFGSIGIELALQHERTRSYGNGFVQTTYQVISVLGEGDQL
jgi:dihydrofolate reductase